MPQTMLALLALMTATTMALTWQRDSIRAQQNIIEAELQVEARGVVNEVFERVSSLLRADSLQFDENLSISTPADLSDEASFGTNKNWEDIGTPTVDDIDDLHNMRPYNIIRHMTNPLTGEPAEVAFQILAKVDYVDDASGTELKGSDGNEPTFYKRFTLSVIPQTGYRDAQRDTIRVSRVFSYNF